jgi:hypothetical protein
MILNTIYFVDMINSRPYFYALIKKNCTIPSFPRKRESYFSSLQERISELPAYAGMTLSGLFLCSFKVYISMF